MDGIFNIPYSEYEVINQLSKKFKKTEGYSFYIPTSRTQKGIDFILHNNNKNKMLRFQVKGSRAYINKPKKLRSGKYKEIKHKYGMWFNNFIERYKKGNSDYYLLFGLYPVYQQNKNIKNASWKPLILCFNEKEMFTFLKKVKTKKGSEDKFFDIQFNTSDDVCASRGFQEAYNLSDYLLKNKLDELKSKF